MTEPVESINELNKDLFNREDDDPFTDPGEARKKAMDYLARREYGRLELQAKLEHAGFHSAPAEIILTLLPYFSLIFLKTFIEISNPFLG